MPGWNNQIKNRIGVKSNLITQKYNRPEKLFATGKSAGGTLMGVIANMRPDLFKGIINENFWRQMRLL
jgi:oligopeptidase B